MQFPAIHPIPQPSVQSGVVPVMPAVRATEPVAAVRNDEQQGRLPPEGRYSPSSSAKTGAMEFRVDEGSDRLVVSLYDDRGDVIRQIPAESILKMARQITEMLRQRDAAPPPTTAPPSASDVADDRSRPLSTGDAA